MEPCELAALLALVVHQPRHSVEQQHLVCTGDTGVRGELSICEAVNQVVACRPGDRCRIPLKRRDIIVSLTAIRFGRAEKSVSNGRCLRSCGGFRLELVITEAIDKAARGAKVDVTFRPAAAKQVIESHVGRFRADAAGTRDRYVSARLIDDREDNACKVAVLGLIIIGQCYDISGIHVVCKE